MSVKETDDKGEPPWPGRSDGARRRSRRWWGTGGAEGTEENVTDEEEEKSEGKRVKEERKEEEEEEEEEDPELSKRERESASFWRSCQGVSLGLRAGMQRHSEQAMSYAEAVVSSTLTEVQLLPTHWVSSAHVQNCWPLSLNWSLHSAAGDMVPRLKMVTSPTRPATSSAALSGHDHRRMRARAAR
jgi:hypothetical protein